MSNSVTNVEMEDVLSSIRRLVSDEVEARRDQSGDEKRLVLSNSHRINDAGDAVETAPMASEADQLQALSTLEATIAELEAAVGGTGNFDPDLGDASEGVSDPPAIFKSSKVLHEPEALSFIPRSEDPKPVPDVEIAEDIPKPEPLQLTEAVQVANDPVDPAVPQPEPEEVEEVLLDEETLKQLVRTIVREELQGTLGEAITRNIRKLIRREIHAYFDVKDGL